MTLLILVGVLLLETFWTQLSQIRNHQLVEQYSSGWQKVFNKNGKHTPWFVVAAVMLPPVLILAVLLNGQHGFVGFLFELILGLIIVSWSLGPMNLNTFYHQLEEQDDLDEDALAKELFEYVHTAYFGIIFWFVLLGPVAAFAYRMVLVLSEPKFDDQDKQESTVTSVETLNCFKQLFFVIDWVPARVSGFLFLLTGNFAAGFGTLKSRLSKTSYSENHIELVQETGFKAMALQNDENPLTAARQLTERSLLLLMVLIALITFFQL